MAIEDLQRRAPVIAAAREYDRIGPDAFRSRYRSARAKRYFLVLGKRRYDLKPILAAAHNVALPAKPPVTSRSFHTHAGRAVAQRVGFEVFVSPAAADIEAQRRQIAEIHKFDPRSVTDARTRIVTAIVQRQGQAQFRKKLLGAYANRCAISNCDVEQVLEGVHIISYPGPKTNHVTNGLLLRADLHTLFDLFLLAVNPQSMKVMLSERLRGSEYWQFQNRKLRVPSREDLRPSRTALDQHWRDADADRAV